MCENGSKISRVPKHRGSFIVSVTSSVFSWGGGLHITMPLSEGGMFVFYIFE